MWLFHHLNTQNFPTTSFHFPLLFHHHILTLSCQRVKYTKPPSLKWNLFAVIAPEPKKGWAHHGFSICVLNEWMILLLSQHNLWISFSIHKLYAPEVNHMQIYVTWRCGDICRAVHILTVLILTFSHRDFQPKWGYFCNKINHTTQHVLFAKVNVILLMYLQEKTITNR